MAFFTLNAFCADYESNLYQGYLETSGKSFYNSDYIFFSGGWDSTNDTIQTPSLYLDNDASQSASQKFYNITGISFIGVEDFYVEDGASATICNSSINISNQLKVEDVHFYNNFASQLTLKNSETRITLTEASKIGAGASMTVDGGNFTVVDNASYKQFAVTQGSSLTFKNAYVDLSGAELSTLTDSTYSNRFASINIENSSFKSGYVDLYGYESSGAFPSSISRRVQMLQYRS